MNLVKISPAHRSNCKLRNGKNSSARIKARYLRMHTPRFSTWNEIRGLLFVKSLFRSVLALFSYIFLLQTVFFPFSSHCFTSVYGLYKNSWSSSQCETVDNEIINLKKVFSGSLNKALQVEFFEYYTRR